MSAMNVNSLPPVPFDRRRHHRRRHSPSTSSPQISTSAHFSHIPVSLPYPGRLPETEPTTSLFGNEQQPQPKSAPELQFFHSKFATHPSHSPFHHDNTPPSSEHDYHAKFRNYTNPERSKEPPGVITHSTLQSSIPMANESLSSTFHLSAYQASSPNTSEALDPGHSPQNDDVDSDAQAAASDAPPSTSKSNSTVSKKKQSKMHECEVCGKMFPRPSGLKTHMNTHNNLKPFPCEFHGCTRTFTVRSNAKRHLRTHGVDVSVRSRPTASPPYVVGFETPTVVPPPPPPATEHTMTKVPFRVRWMPLSLVSRTNARRLRSLSDNDSESDYEQELTLGDGGDAGSASSSSVSPGGEGGPTLSIPLHPPPFPFYSQGT